MTKTKDEAREAAWRRLCGWSDLVLIEKPTDVKALSKKAGFDTGFDAGYEFANKWHVIERDGLPPSRGRYDVTNSLDRVEVCDFNPDDLLDVIRWQSFTAWRPRPEPYKGE